MRPEQLTLIDLPSAAPTAKGKQRLAALATKFASAMEDWPQHEKERFLLEIERLTVLQFLERFSVEQRQAFAVRLLEDVLRDGDKTA